jgi:hypothetical protein
VASTQLEHRLEQRARFAERGPAIAPERQEEPRTASVAGVWATTAAIFVGLVATLRRNLSGAGGEVGQFARTWWYCFGFRLGLGKVERLWGFSKAELPPTTQAAVIFWRPQMP